MGIRILDERHKKLAEHLLKGTPRTKAAEEIGVARQTLYEWMQDPMFQNYLEHLARDIEAARQQRLLPVNQAMVELALATIQRELDRITANDPDAANLDTISQVLKRLVETERLDQGKPTVHTKKSGGNPGEEEVTDDAVGGLLRRLLDVKPEKEKDAELYEVADDSK